MYIKLDTYEDIKEGKYTAAIIAAVEVGRFRPMIAAQRERNKNLKDKGIDEVKTHLENEVALAFGDTIVIAEDPSKASNRAIEIMEEDNITIYQLKYFPRFSPYSMSEFDAAPIPLDIVPAKSK